MHYERSSGFIGVCAYLLHEIGADTLVSVLWVNQDTVQVVCAGVSVFRHVYDCRGDTVMSFGVA